MDWNALWWNFDPVFLDKTSGQRWVQSPWLVTCFSVPEITGQKPGSQWRDGQRWDDLSLSQWGNPPEMGNPLGISFGSLDAVVFFSTASCQKFQAVSPQRPGSVTWVSLKIGKKTQDLLFSWEKHGKPSIFWGFLIFRQSCFQFLFGWIHTVFGCFWFVFGGRFCVFSWC